MTVQALTKTFILWVLQENVQQVKFVQLVLQSQKTVLQSPISHQLKQMPVKSALLASTVLQRDYLKLLIVMLGTIATRIHL
jgi:hypothetical protein